MNITILRGRLTADPEVRITNDAQPMTIARFCLAVPDRTKRDSNGNYATDFVKVVCFNTIADNAQTYTSKGSEVIITGRLHTYCYKNKKEQTVYMTEVITEKLEFIADCKKAAADIPDIPDEGMPFK